MLNVTMYVASKEKELKGLKNIGRYYKGEITIDELCKLNLGKSADEVSADAVEVEAAKEESTEFVLVSDTESESVEVVDNSKISEDMLKVSNEIKQWLSGDDYEKIIEVMKTLIHPEVVKNYILKEVGIEIPESVAESVATGIVDILSQMETMEGITTIMVLQSLIMIVIEGVNSHFNSEKPDNAEYEVSVEDRAELFNEFKELWGDDVPVAFSNKLDNGDYDYMIYRIKELETSQHPEDDSVIEDVYVTDQPQDTDIILESDPIIDNAVVGANQVDFNKNGKNQSKKNDKDRNKNQQQQKEQKSDKPKAMTQEEANAKAQMYFDTVILPRFNAAGQTASISLRQDGLYDITPQLNNGMVWFVAHYQRFAIDVAGKEFGKMDKIFRVDPNTGYVTCAHIDDPYALAFCEESIDSIIVNGTDQAFAFARGTDLDVFCNDEEVKSLKRYINMNTFKPLLPSQDKKKFIINTLKMLRPNGELRKLLEPAINTLGEGVSPICTSGLEIIKDADGNEKKRYTLFGVKIGMQYFISIEDGAIVNVNNL